MTTERLAILRKVGDSDTQDLIALLDLRDVEIAQLRMREASVLHVGSCADAMLVHLETGCAWECTCECALVKP